MSGELNKLSFGVLAAGDEWPGESFADFRAPFPGKNANYFIGRMKYSLKGEDYFGLLYSGREFGDTFNRVLAGDLSFRLPGGHNISVNGIYTLSRDADAPEKSAGNAFTVLYNYGQKPLNMTFALEGYSRDFRMDSAFYLQNGFTRFTGFISPNFYPQAGKWFRPHPGVPRGLWLLFPQPLFRPERYLPAAGHPFLPAAQQLYRIGLYPHQGRLAGPELTTRTCWKSTGARCRPAG